MRRLSQRNPTVWLVWAGPTEDTAVVVGATTTESEAAAVLDVLAAERPGYYNMAEDRPSPIHLEPGERRALVVVTSEDDVVEVYDNANAASRAAARIPGNARLTTLITNSYLGEDPDLTPR